MRVAFLILVFPSLALATPPPVQLSFDASNNLTVIALSPMTIYGDSSTLNIFAPDGVSLIGAPAGWSGTATTAAGPNPASLSVSGGSQLVVADTISTVGAQSYSVPILVDTPVVFAASSVALSASISGAAVTLTGGLTIDGDLTVDTDSLTASAIDAAAAPTSTAKLTVTKFATLNGEVGKNHPLDSLVFYEPLTVATDFIAATTFETVDVTNLNTDCTIQGGTLNIYNSINGAYALTLDGNVNLSPNVGNFTKLTSLHITGPVTVSGSFIETTGPQTYDGAVTLNATPIFIATSASFNSSIYVAYDFTVEGDASLTSAGATTPVASIGVSGATSFLGGSLTTTGTQTYSGDAALNGDTTIVASGTTLGGKLDGAFAAQFSGAVDFLGDAKINTSALTLGGETNLHGHHLVANIAGPVVVSGSLSQVASLAVDSSSANGAQTWSFSDVAPVTYLRSGTGLITFASGTFNLHADNVMDSGATLVVAAPATLALNGHDASIASLSGPGTVDLSGGVLTLGSDSDMQTDTVLVGSGALTKSGTGRLVLTGASTFSGGTEISGGIVSVENTSGSATGSGAVTLDAGTTLSGTGSIAGAVTLISATLAPGTTSSFYGHLRTGALTADSQSTFAFEIAGATEDLADAVIANGPISIDGTLALTFLNDFAPAVGTNYTLLLEAALLPVTGQWVGDSNDSVLQVGGTYLQVNYTNGATVQVVDAPVFVPPPAPTFPPVLAKPVTTKPAAKGCHGTASPDLAPLLVVLFIWERRRKRLAML